MSEIQMNRKINGYLKIK